METEPYSIYYENRPLRIAFLVDPNDTHSLIDQIIEYNRDKWGGRFNPIILTDGNTIDEHWWKFLRNYDPDIIFATKNLSDELREKIQIFLTPLRVITVRDEAHPYINIDDEPISILPTRKIVSILSNNFFGDDSTLALFELEEGTSQDIKDFVIRNFGIYPTGQRVPILLKRALESCQTKTFKVKDFESLNEALLDIGDFHHRYIFPSQICSIPNSLKDVEHNYKRDHFEIIIGDSNEDLAYFWNRTLSLRQWVRPRFTHFWASKALMNESAVKSGLISFINRYTGEIGDNSHHKVSLVSLSLEENELKNISALFDDKIHYAKTVAKYSETQIPEFSDRSFFFLRRGLDFFRGKSVEEHLVIEQPDIEEGSMGGQHWVTDFFIQYRPETLKSIFGKDHWWQLPKRNGLLSNLHFFNKPARINEQGMFSILMKRKNTFDPDESTVVVKIPTDDSVFRGLILGESYKNISKDPRETFLSRPFYTIRVSLMGKYLRGVLSLFPDMHAAYRLFEERYIRKMFERMSNMRSTKDKKLIEDTKQQLKKKIDSEVDLTSDEGLSWLADKAIKTSKQIGNSDKSLLFSHFVEEAQDETNEYNKLNPTNQFEVDEDDIKDKLTELIESGILLSGINVNCPRCSDKNWYHINDVKQTVKCAGCGYEFIVPAEQRWSYRLNNMIREAFAEHGTVPVLLVLGQLFMDARSSFMYIPCVDLFTKAEGEEPKLNTDLDISCIVDGKFVIGEVKQSVGLFGQKDFTNMAEIAELLKPDKIIFSSLDKKPNKFVRDEIAKLKTKLASLEIEVEWYPIHDYVFEPSPVR